MYSRRLLAVVIAIASILMSAVPAQARVLSGRAATNSVQLGNLEVTPASIDFGATTGASRNVTLRNVGGSPVTIFGAEITDGNFSVSPRSGGTIAPGGTMTYTVSTKYYDGPTWGALLIRSDQYRYPGEDADNEDAGKIFIPLSADIVVNYGDFGLASPSEVTFPVTRVGETATTTVTVMDASGYGAVYRIDAPRFSDASLTSPDFPSGSRYSDYETFTVRWAPTAAGTLDASAMVRSNSGSLLVRFRGTAVTGPALAAGSITFPDTDLGATSSRSISVTNTGSAATVASVQIDAGATNAGAGDFASTAAPTQIAAGGTATYTFAFSPTAVGARSASARLVDAQGRTLLAIPLSGQAHGALAEVRSQLDFGSVLTGRSRSRELVIKNAGDRDLPLDTLGVQGPAGPFSVAGDLAPIPAGGSRAVTVRFAPTSDGGVSRSLTLSPAGLPVTTVALTGVGASSLPLSEEAPAASGGGVPTDVVTGDFDEDGKADAVLGFAASGEVRFARGLGDGSFAAPAAIGRASAPGALGLAVGDVNEDGHVDVLVASAAGSQVLLGAGDGSFTSTPLALAADVVALADFTDDGHLDLVAGLSSASVISRVRRMTGVGDGSFTGLVMTSLEGAPTGLTVADLQRDGDMDYVFSFTYSDGRFGGRTGVNDGTGTFGGTVVVPDSGGVAIGQLDAGLLPDVSFGAKLLLNLRGTALVAGGAGGDVVRLADFDGDGQDDQVAARRGSPLVSVSLGNGAGGFAPSIDVGTDAPGSSEPADLAVADLNGDGLPDVLGALGGEQLSVLLSAAPTGGSGAGKAVISELRFGGDGYVQVVNTSRTKDLSLDGWQLRFPGGRAFAFPAGVRVAPRGVALVTGPVRGAPATWNLLSIARGLVGLPASATGVALVDRGGAAVDAAGLTSAPAAFREGAGLPVVSFRGQGAYVRKVTAGSWADTGQNADDFRALDTGAQPGDGTVLGSPRPDKPTDPTNRNDILQSSLIDPSKPASAVPNREVVDGKLLIRRVVTNCSGGLTTGACKNADPDAPAVVVNRIRFRVTDLSTIGTSTGAILKAVPIGNVSPYTMGVNLQAPTPQTGGGINATITPVQWPGTLMPGQSFEIEFAFTVVRGGTFRFGYDTEDDLELLPKPVAPPAAEEKVPEAAPVSEVVTGTAPASAAVPSPAGSPPSSAAPAKTAGVQTPVAKKAKCVTRSQRGKLRGKARAKAKLCKQVKKRPTSTTGKAKR